MAFTRNYRGPSRGRGQTRVPRYVEESNRRIMAILEANGRELEAYEAGQKSEPQLEAEARLRRIQSDRWRTLQAERPAGEHGAELCEAIALHYREKVAPMFEECAREWRDHEELWAARRIEMLARWGQPQTVPGGDLVVLGTGPDTLRAEELSEVVDEEVCVGVH